MFAVIRTTVSVRRAIYYNEAKVSRGVAACIGGSNYPVDAAKTTTVQKLNRLLDQASLHEGVKRSCVHITLNFHPGERMSDHLLMKIAAAYMNRICLQQQPWVAYRHYDAGHPHVHIVSVAITEEGKRIRIYRIRRLFGKKAQMETEAPFGLRPNRPAGIPVLRSGRPQRISYGESSSARAIAGVLNAVINGYNYTDLAGLNAVLASYRLVANRGGEKSRIRQRGGLLYQILSDKGKKTGMPVKASSLPGKPVLALLEAKFRENTISRRINRGYERQAIKNAVGILMRTADSLEALREGLGREGISMIMAENEGTGTMELTYVDHVRKSVAREGELGAACCIREINRKIEIRASATDLAGLGAMKEEAGAPASGETGNKAVKLPLSSGGEKDTEEPELQWRKRTCHHL